MESDIQKKIIKEATKQGWYCVKIIQCNRNGWPDLMLLRSGVTVFVEVKQPGKQLRPLQEYRRKEIEACGFTFIVATDSKFLSGAEFKLKTI